MGMRRLEWFIDGIYHLFLRRLAYSLRRCRLSMFSLYLALRLSHTHKSTTNQSLPKHERQWLSSDPAQERIPTTTHSDIHIEYHIQIPIKSNPHPSTPAPIFDRCRNRRHSIIPPYVIPPQPQKRSDARQPMPKRTLTSTGPSAAPALTQWAIFSPAASAQPNPPFSTQPVDHTLASITSSPLSPPLSSPPQHIITSLVPSPPLSPHPNCASRPAIGRVYRCLSAAARRPCSGNWCSCMRLSQLVM